MPGLYISCESGAPRRRLDKEYVERSDTGGDTPSLPVSSFIITY
jgi:hypothetical protein